MAFSAAFLFEKIAPLKKLASHLRLKILSVRQTGCPARATRNSGSYAPDSPVVAADLRFF
jgi:hypothetical protein